MLTEQERQQIENEERKKLAEEQYRAEVRSRLQGENAVTPKKSRRLPWLLGLAALLVIGAFVGAMNSNTYHTKKAEDASTVQSAAKPSPVPRTRYVPVNQKIASGQIIVNAKGYVQYRITITPEMLEPIVKGSFNASGGSGNDIQAVIADEPNFTNWINGHEAQVFWGTQGRETTGSFEVRLRPGMYYLVFSNKFSAFTNKQVFLDVDLNFQKSETYYE